MACDDIKNAFNDKFGEVQKILQDELSAIADDSEKRAQELADDFEEDSELSQGVGAAAGTVVGGFFGGPGAAAVGHVIGRTIGSLFTLEIEMRRQSFSLDIPYTRMEARDFSFDLPTVVLKNTDISFDIPGIEIRRVEGPPIPHTTVRWEQRCIDLPFGQRACTDVPVTVVEMKPSYLDVPVSVMKRQHIVIGVPQVELRRQHFKVDVPTITMKTTEFSAEIPSIRIEFIKDAGKRTASMASALAQSAQDAAAQKQIAYKERLRTEVAPLAVNMFDCFRGQIKDGRAMILAQFSGQIETLQNSVASFVAKGVPEDNADLKQTRASLADVLTRQADALKPLDEALEKLDAASTAALAQFMEGTKGPAKTTGGLIKYTKSRAGGRDVAGLVSLATRSTTKGVYLTIGLNSFDPAAYGNSGTLTACEFDATDMAEIAKKCGFKGNTLLTKKATSAAVLSAITNAATTLQSGDIFLLTYSGHGGQVGDVTGDEPDSLDETWCLYDRQLVDDELWAMWAKFKVGVRIVVVSDSCHSGTVTKAWVRSLHYRALDSALKADPKLIGEFREMTSKLKLVPSIGPAKAIPFEQSWEMYVKNKEMYDSLQLVAGDKEANKAAMGASILLLSGCQDNQLSLDGSRNGAFTAALKEAWDDGGFSGTYKGFHKAILDLPLPPNQTPNYYFTGASNPAFEAQRPFSI